MSSLNLISGQNLVEHYFSQVWWNKISILKPITDGISQTLNKRRKSKAPDSFCYLFLAAPLGHSTAPADTVLQLNFPLPPPSANKASSLLASLSQSSRRDENNKARTNSLTDSVGSLSSSTNVSLKEEVSSSGKSLTPSSRESSQTSGVSSAASSLLSAAVKMKGPGSSVDAMGR